MNFVKPSLLILLVFLHLSCTSNAQKENDISDSISTGISTLKITTLSTMLANRGIGEWGYSALVEVDGKKILFDTGNRPETVLQNAEELGIDLSEVEDVFISHNHGDHTGGLLTLRSELKNRNPNALKTVHVAHGIFSPRVNSTNKMISIKKQLEADGVTIIEYKNQFELFPDIWITGPVERIHEERNWGGNGKIITEKGTIEDNIPEDQSLVIDTVEGFVLISGCGHAGIINTMEHIRSKIHAKKILAAIGGFHLVNATNAHLKWTADRLREFGVSKIIGAHCTGVNSLYTLRDLLDMTRNDAVVGSVGDSFDLQYGIKAGVIAR